MTTAPPAFTDRFIGNLDEHAAAELLHAIADRFGWQMVLWTRGDANAYLFDYADHNTGMTDRQWRRLSATTAWRVIAEVARRNVHDAGTLGAAAAQACLTCAECGTYLLGLPRVTWGLCEDCRGLADVATLRQRPCPTADTHSGRHEYTDGACRFCGLPETDPPADVPGLSTGDPGGRGEPAADGSAWEEDR